jgi:tripartite ATP-independent transporter DctM subunit
MIDLKPEIITIIMLGGILFGVLLGYHTGIVVGAVGLAVGYMLWGSTVFELIYQRFYTMVLSYPFLAAPLFIFMGAMLERSGVSETLYDALYSWLGGLRGGLAITTILMGTILAACVGIIGASVTMLALVALPAMVKRGYAKSLASGSVCAGGTLGILIPPSIMLVIYGPMAVVSVGKLFMAAIFPGLLLSFLYCSYIGIRCLIQSDIAPPVPIEERRVPFIRKTIKVIIAVVPTAAIILSVLGTIFFGLAPPTEAGAIGAMAATLLAIAYRKFTFRTLKETVLRTMHITSMIMLIGVMSVAFVGVFMSARCGNVVQEVILSTPGGKWGVFSVIMLIIFILGFFIEWIGIIFIIIPIVTPVGDALGFDSVWFGMMICVNLQMAFMTPPFASAIFYLRGSAPRELGITMHDIIRGVSPFVILIMVALALCAIFPEVILWLPGKMIR